MQAIDNYGGRDFWYKKVLSRPRKADNESEERICWGREFQMEGEAKENDAIGLLKKVFLLKIY